MESQQSVIIDCNNGTNVTLKAGKGENYVIGKIYIV
jgi:hypothetical protein